MNLKKIRRSEPAINLTSLIDVVFLLLIFFMVSTTFQKNKEISLDLPEAQLDTSQKNQDAVIISITKTGEYFVNGQVIAQIENGHDINQSLFRVLESFKSPSQDPPLIISADALTSHQAVVRVMDVSAQLGFEHINIATTEVHNDTR